MKVLVLRPDHIGDMLLTTPFLSALRKALPEAEIHLLSGSWSASMVDNNPNLDKLFICNFPWLARGGDSSKVKFAKEMMELRNNKYDAVFNLRKAVKTSMTAKFIGGKDVYGFDVGKSKWAHTKHVEYRTDINIADLYLEFVGKFFGKPEHNGLEMFFSEKEVEDYNEFYNRSNNYLVFAPGAGYKEKYWDLQNWSELTRKMISEYGIEVYYIGGPGDRDFIDIIKKDFPVGMYNHAGELSLRNSALLIKNARAVVSVDSAAMHMASAVKTPVAALFGPTNPVHWGPYPNGCKNVTISKVSSFELGRGSTNKDGGMNLIDAGEVKDAVVKILDDGES